MEYKAIIVKHGESYLLFFEKEVGVFSDGIPVTDSEHVYDNLRESNVNFCKVQFCVGDEAKPFESFEKLEEITFKIKDLAVIIICDKEGNETNSLEALNIDGENLMKAFFVEEVFNY